MDKIRDGIVRAALALSALLPAYFLVAAMGVKFRLLDWRFGFGELTLGWGPKLMIGAALVALVAFLLAAFVPPRRGLGLALIALLIPLGGLGYGLYVRQQAMGVPPIHDVTTDMIDPPGFSAEVMRARAAVPDGNGAAVDASAMAQQREAYPEIAYVITGIDQQHAFEGALALAREQGWKIGRTDPQAGVIEAAAESFWYGFVDDIVVRVRAEGSGARIDMRSVSRVGRSDLGANARRMRIYLAALTARLRAAEGA